MSDATTGVAQAKARVRTIPKLSPPSEGATSAFADASSMVRSSWLRKPRTSMPSSETRSRVSRSRTASGSAPAIRRRAPVRRRISGHARKSTCSPFRGSWRPANTSRCSRPPGSTSSGMSTPFGTISYSPGSQRCADSRACSETAIRRSSRSSRKPQTGVASRIQPRSPLAWCVPTIGPSNRASAAMQGVGVIGSCRWRMSNRSCASTRRIRKIERGLRMMFGSDPFAGTITDRPIGITSGGGSPWRPTRGCRTRVNCPGGSLPMISRTPCPRSRSAAACSSSCPTTAPQKDQENGTTMPTFISARVYARLHNGPVQLEGVHHVTLITGDAPRNVDFYTGVLGLRLVKKTVNQDDPTVYHLFYADERGSAGSDITFFEYPGATRGRAGPGMVHTIVWRVAAAEALDFWEQRLQERAENVSRSGNSLTFEDPEGVRHELRVVETPDEPLVAQHPEIPGEHALQGFDGVRAYSIDPELSTALLEDTLGFQPRGDYTWEVRGEQRGGWYAYDTAPESRGIPGAGTVHHVAWATTMEEHEAWRGRPGAARDR